jgi:hypothetical protein
VLSAGGALGGGVTHLDRMNRPGKNEKVKKELFFFSWPFFYKFPFWKNII